MGSHKKEMVFDAAPTDLKFIFGKTYTNSGSYRNGDKFICTRSWSKDTFSCKDTVNGQTSTGTITAEGTGAETLHMWGQTAKSNLGGGTIKWSNGLTWS